MDAPGSIVVVALVVAALAGLAALWAHASRARLDVERRLRTAESRLERMRARQDELEREVARQGVELEEQGIRLETQAYWQED